MALPIPGGDSTVTRQDVDQRGGVVATSDGSVTLTIPPDTFKTATTVTLTDLPVQPPLILNERYLKPLRILQIAATLPDGTPAIDTFGAQPTLAVSYTADDLFGSAGQLVVLHWRDNEKSEWQPVVFDHDHERFTISAKLDHFSDYMASVDLNLAISPTVEGYQTQLYMGAATASIPLKLPPGTNGLTPTLNLVYSSGGPNGLISEFHDSYGRAQASWVGIGWQLDLGYIGLNTSGTLRRGQLVLNGSSYDLIYDEPTSVYSVQDNNFLKATEMSETIGSDVYEYFSVQDKEGITYRFGHEPHGWSASSADFYTGHEAGSRQDGYATDHCDNGPPYLRWSQKILRYYLDLITDTHGNSIEIIYHADKGTRTNPGYCPQETVYWDQAVYPTEIHYSMNDAGGYKRKVVFVTSDPTTVQRQDIPPATDYYQTRRLEHVEVYLANAGGSWALVRTYDLTYSYQTAGTGSEQGSKFLVLTSVIENDNAGLSLPTTTFTYSFSAGWQGGGTNTCPIPLLTQVDNGYGGIVSYAYTIYKWKDYGGVSTALTSYAAVSSKTVQDGMGNSQVTTYTPSNPMGAAIAGWTTKFNSGTGTGYPIFRGFAAMDVTEPPDVGDASGRRHEHRFFRGLDLGALTIAVTRSDATNFWDEEQYKGREFEVIYREASGTVLGTDWTVFTTNPSPASNHAPGTPPPGDHEDWHVYGVFVQEKRTTRGAKSTKQTFTYDATYGNLIDTFDYLLAADSNWTRHTKRYYPAPVVGTHYVVGKPTAENVYSYGIADGIFQSSTYYLYDGSTSYTAAIGSGASGDDGSFRGRLTRVKRWLLISGVNDYAETGFVYDAYGNQTQINKYLALGTLTTLAVGSTQQTLIAYDATYHSFPLTTTNPVGKVESRTFDNASGKPLTVTDANSQVTTSTYDSFKRLLSVTGPTVASAYAKTVQYVYSLPATASGKTTTRIKIQVRTDNGGTAAWFTQYRFYDGTGQLVQQYADAVGGYSTVTNNRYHGRRLLSTASVPFLVASLSGTFDQASWTANSQKLTKRTYDALRRPLITTLPDATATEIQYADWDQLVFDQNDHKKTLTKDGFGRAIQVVEYTGAGTYAVYATTKYTYDVLDRLLTVVDSAAGSAGGTGGNVTTLVYDTLGRKTQMTDPDMGVWSYAYDSLGNLISQTDARSKTITFLYDLTNRLVSKWYPMEWTEGMITAGASRPTVHDLIELRSAIDTDYAASGHTTFGVWSDDELIAGRTGRVRATHFNEIRARINVLRGWAGLAALATNAAWPLSSTSRMRAQHLTDLRGWLTTYETEVGTSSTPNARARAYYAYDSGVFSSANPNGHLCWTSHGSGRQWFSYDVAGRLAQESPLIDGHTYTTQYTYDAMDRIRTLVYPIDGGVTETLTSTYGADTLLTQLTSSIGSLNLLSSAVYNAFGLPTSYLLGGSALQTQSYYGIEYTTSLSPFGAVRALKLQVGSNPALVDRTLSYSLVGNPTSIVDAVNSETLAYAYDDLDRLTSVSSPFSEAYAYDQIGNITSKGGVGYTYTNAAHKHAVATLAGVLTYTYDANGNMITRPSQTLQYNPENRLTRVTSGSTISRYSYDGNGKRTKRLDANGTIHYPSPHIESNVGWATGAAPIFTKYYYATIGSQRRLLAFRKGGTLYYVGSDHLGGTIRLMNSSFTALDQMRYKPYGSSRDTGAALQTDRLFTGQTQDAIAGTYWYGSRMYDSELGRFCQPDSLVPRVVNPQSLNRYTYVLNCPTRFTDPSGYDPLDAAWEAAFKDAHGGAAPTDLDRQDRLLSLIITGSGPGGAWNATDWSKFNSNRASYYDRKFADSHRMPGETGVAQFTRYASALASWYNAGEAAKYVRAFALLFGGIRYSGDASTVFGPDFGFLNIDPSGMKPEFLTSTDPSDNQSHHYAGFVFLGYQQGYYNASAINWVREVFQGKGNPDQADVALGTVGAQDGAQFSQLGLFADLGALAALMARDLPALT